jgi:hypothetical protein
LSNACHENPVKGALTIAVKSQPIFLQAVEKFACSGYNGVVSNFYVSQRAHFAVL